MSTIKPHTTLPTSSLFSRPTAGLSACHEDSDAGTSSSVRRTSRHRVIASFMVALAGTWLSLASVGSAAPRSTAPAPASTAPTTRPGSTTKPKTETDVRKIAEEALKQYIAERTKGATWRNHNGTDELAAAPQKARICILGVCASCGTEDLGEKSLTNYCFIQVCDDDKCSGCVVTDNLGSGCGTVAR